MMQMQGNMLVTGRDWWDYLEFHPDLPSKPVRVPRNERICDSLASAIGKFVEDLDQWKSVLRLKGFEGVEKTMHTEGDHNNG